MPWFSRAIPHNSKCRYGERGAADAVPQLPERCLSRKAGIVRCCPRQNKIGPCLGAAGADKFSDSNNSKMRKRKLYRSMGAVLAFSQVFSSSVRRGLSISYTWAWYAFSQLIWSRVSSSTMTGSVEMGTRVSGSNFSQ